MFFVWTFSPTRQILQAASSRPPALRNCLFIGVEHHTRTTDDRFSDADDKKDVCQYVTAVAGRRGLQGGARWACPGWGHPANGVEQNGVREHLLWSKRWCPPWPNHRVLRRHRASGRAGIKRRLGCAVEGWGCGGAGSECFGAVGSRKPGTRAVWLWDRRQRGVALQAAREQRRAKEGWCGRAGAWAYGGVGEHGAAPTLARGPGRRRWEFGESD
jgi:hypothetical protein